MREGCRNLLTQHNTGRKEERNRRLTRVGSTVFDSCCASRRGCGIDPVVGGAAMRAQLSLAYWPGCVGIARPTSEPCAREMYRECVVWSVKWPTMSSALHSRLPAAPTSTYPFDDINLLSPASPSSSSSCTFFFDQSRSVFVLWDYVKRHTNKYQPNNSYIRQIHSWIYYVNN